MGGSASDNQIPACVEHGQWTPVPRPVPDGPLVLGLGTVDPAEADRIAAAGALSFHVVGCTGDDTNHAPQTQVAAAMAAQLADPDALGRSHGPARPASFLYHLGDIVYKPDAEDNSSHDAPGNPDGVDQRRLYDEQFYRPYAAYRRSIFAIAGNHDGKVSHHAHKSAIDHFLANFCAAERVVSPDNATDDRPAMVQPHVYWRLETPLATVIGLDANVANGGILDDPAQDERPQYEWLVEQLRDVGQRAGASGPKAVILAVHYPPYSGAASFAQRGDPTLGPSPHAGRARPLGAVLREAYLESGIRPDAVVSAHAHLYQRLTYRCADGWEIPHLVVGSGGHGPVERLGTRCDGTRTMPPAVPFAAVLPPGLTLPLDEEVQVAAYDDQDFGFARLTVADGTLGGEFFAVKPDSSALADAFALDLRTHRLRATAVSARPPAVSPAPRSAG